MSHVVDCLPSKRGIVGPQRKPQEKMQGLVLLLGWGSGFDGGLASHGRVGPRAQLAHWLTVPACSCSSLLRIWWVPMRTQTSSSLSESVRRVACAIQDFPQGLSSQQAKLASEEP